MSEQTDAAEPLKTGWSLPKVFFLLAAELIFLTLLQLPGLADFQKFGFYDEGAWLHLDQLFAGGAVPTVDVGYSYGMLPLLLSRGWFAILGRTPWAFIGFVLVCNLISVWGVARIVEAAGATRGRVIAACCLLPLGIMPNTYSLMHPLEMMLIISALAEQVRGRVGWALVFATLGVFTKPSMAYVLGFLLLVGALGRAQRWVRIILPPVVTALVFLAMSILIVGVGPTAANILPLTGGRSYKAMNFGFFHAGRTFWAHAGGAGEMVNHYVFNPALYWILATLAVWGLGMGAVGRLWRRGKSEGASGDFRFLIFDLRLGGEGRDRFLVMVGLLHAAFVFVFYAWEGSWTYYSYLLVIGLIVGFGEGTGDFRFLNFDFRLGGGRVLGVFAVVGVLGLSQKYLDAWSRWQGMERMPEAGGLWVYGDVLEEAKQVRALVRQRRGMYLVNGTLPTIWGDAPPPVTPPCWFLSPGIPTAGEIAKVKAQMAAAGVVVLYKDYDQDQEAWKWAEFREEREMFEAVPVLETRHFRVLGRKK